jgi:hypothetical protein
MSQWLPDFHDELRWPLSTTQHPTFEPSFAIADQLAMPGVTWQQLCQRGAQSRYGAKRDLNAYLLAWCQALEDRFDDAFETLLPLARSTAISNFDDIVRVDLATMLASCGHADVAEHAINKHKIADIAVLDLLAANYVETGTVRDAMQINTLAMNANTPTPDATKCMRWTRHIVLLGDRESSYYVQMKKLSDPTCAALAHKLACWSGADFCNAYVDDNKWPPSVGYLIEAYRMWLWAGRDPAKWLDVAHTAQAALAQPGGADLAVGALENVEITDTTCDKDAIELAADLQRRVELSPRPDLRDRARIVHERCIEKKKAKYGAR